MEELKIKETDTYKEIKEKMRNYENDKYSDFVLEKEDIKIEYGFPIFDVENKDKNKSLDAISFCNNLGNDYIRVAHWLVGNTQYYPGLMRLDLKAFIVSEKLKFTLMISSKDDYVIPFTSTFNKEDGELECITFKYKEDKFRIHNLFVATDYYYGLSKLREELNDKNKEVEKRLNNIAIF